MNKDLKFRKLATLSTMAVLLVGLILLPGCASTPSDQRPPRQAAEKTGANVPPLPAGVTLHPDKDIQGVWLAEGCSFKGFDTLYIAPPMFAAIERPNEVDMRARAMRVLPEELTHYLGATKLFTTVTTQAEAVKPGSRSLRLETTIIEFEQGGGAARYFGGLFGAGQPVIKVRGQLTDAGKPVCVFEVRRSGESAGARMHGHLISGEEIQRGDISDLASDLADFFKRTAGVP
jgi:hypothetical protein